MRIQILYNGELVSYLVEGNGFPVLLLHGFGENSSIWKQQVAFLKNKYLVIVPDLPGSGNSAFNANISSIDDFADCINAIMKHEKLYKCVMLGHSMGGYITLSFAEKFPEKLQAFGLVHSTAFADSEEKKNIRLKAIAAIEEYGAFSFLKSTTPNLFGQIFKRENAAAIELLIEEGKQFLGNTLKQYYAAMMNRTDKTSVLEKSEMPVLFVAGTEDVAAPLNDVLKQVHLPKIAYIHILENVGHMGMMEAPVLMNVYLLGFADDVTG